jgi:hypothetical protein
MDSSLVTILLIVAAAVALLGAIVSFRIGITKERSQLDRGASQAVRNKPILRNPILWGYVLLVSAFMAVIAYYVGVYGYRP